MVLVEAKHLMGQHNQETHGNWVSHSPVRLLGRGMGAVRNPAPRVRRARPDRAGARPAAPSGDVPVRRPTEFGPTARSETPTTAKPPDFTDMTDEQLYAIVGTENADPDLKAAVFAELDRREEFDEKWTGGSSQVAAAEGFAAAYAARRPLTADQRARQDYEVYVEAMLLRAIEDAGTFLVSDAGRRAGIDERDLLTGRVRRDLVKKYASEEFLRWIGANPAARLTFTEWRDQNRAGPDTVAPRRNQSNISEFG